MSLVIRKSGILTTVQDLGRDGFRRFGINPNGVMDRAAARLLNVLLGNAETAAVLEMHFPAPEILFTEVAGFAVGGADFAAALNGEPIENWHDCFAEAGSVLKFTEKVSGNRAYLAVKGGFLIEPWLGSASTNLTAQIGGFEGRALRGGDELIFKDHQQKGENAHRRISHRIIPFYSCFPTVRIIAGAEFDELTALSEQTFLDRDFIVSANSNRMGFRLRGAPLHLFEKKEMISSAVTFGTIQLLPDGQLIILMADHQTSGGYPRIANVCAIDLPLVAQLGAGDKVAFHQISLEEAESLSSEFERDLNLLKVACRSRQM